MSQYPTSSSSGQIAAGAAAGTGMLVLIGAGIALFAVILMNIYVEMRVKAAQEDDIIYFQFRGDKEAGAEIELTDLELIRIPKRYQKAFGQDAITESAANPGVPADGPGFPLHTSVVKGEVLRSSLFTDASRRSVRSDPKKGERQIALSVESEKQPANLAPGDRIDLLGAIPTARSGTFKYMVVMEYVEVAAVGQRRVETSDSGRSTRYGSITVNVKPEQVKQLLAIQDRLPDRQFRISLRSQQDGSTPETGKEAVVNPDVLETLRIE